MIVKLSDILDIKRDQDAVIMKFAVILLACLVAVISARPEGDKYTSKYDNIDIDQILKNDRLLNNYFKCLMEEGTCTADAKELRSILPDALETKCSKCSEKQQAGAKKIITYIVNNKPDMWQKLMGKYDPEAKYRKSFEDEAKSIGIAV